MMVQLTSSFRDEPLIIVRGGGGHNRERILDIHEFISDMVLLHTKNKAVSLKVANSVVHAATSTKLKGTTSVPREKLQGCGILDFVSYTT